MEKPGCSISFPATQKLLPKRCDDADVDGLTKSHGGILRTNYVTIWHCETHNPALFLTALLSVPSLWHWSLCPPKTISCLITSSLLTLPWAPPPQDDRDGWSAASSLRLRDRSGKKIKPCHTLNFKSPGYPPRQPHVSGVKPVCLLSVTSRASTGVTLTPCPLPHAEATANDQVSAP